MSKSPTTKAEWWELLTEHRDNLTKIVEQWHPVYENYSGLTITAPLAEKVCEGARESIRADSVGNRDPAFVFHLAIDARDHNKVIQILNQTWFGIPESTECWCIPAFGVLCDLCSECWVFDEEDHRV